MLRKATAALIAVLFLISTAHAADLLDYLDIGPKEHIERLSKTFKNGRSVEKRAAAAELEGLIDLNAGSLGESQEAEAILTVIGDKFIPLFWEGNSTTRVRAERSVSHIIDKIQPALDEMGTPRGKATKNILDRFASLMDKQPDNKSCAKLTKRMVSILAKRKLELAIDTDPPLAAIDPVKTAPTPPPTAKPVPVKPLPTPAVAATPAPAPKPSFAIPAVAAKRVKTPTAPSTTPSTTTTPKARAVTKVVAKRVVAKKTSPKRVKTGAKTKANRAKIVSGKMGSSSDVKVISFNKRGKKGKEGKKNKVAVIGSGSSGTNTSGDMVALNLIKLQLNEARGEAKQISALKLAATMEQKIYAHLNGPYSDTHSRTVEVVTAIRKLIGSQSPLVKRAAAEMVGRLGDNDSVGTLIDLLSEKNSDLKKAAVTSLQLITGEDFGLDKEKWIKWRTNNRS